jgi:hypothetical protein
VAVLDWELARIGDPMQDIGWMCTNSWRFGVTEKAVGGFGMLDDFIKGYESASTTGRKVDRQRVKFWQVLGQVTWSIMCLGFGSRWRIGEPRTMEGAAIARRSSEGELDSLNDIVGPTQLLTNAKAILPTKEEEDQPDSASGRFPAGTELLTAVQELLKDEVRPKLDARLGYYSLVAGNMLAMAKRELDFGPSMDAAERKAILGLLQDFEGGLSNEEMEGLSLVLARKELCSAIRDGSAPLNHGPLQVHLWRAASERAWIDQPKYSGLRNARRLAFGTGEQAKL